VALSSGAATRLVSKLHRAVLFFFVSMLLKLGLDTFAVVVLDKIETPLPLRMLNTNRAVGCVLLLRYISDYLLTKCNRLQRDARDVQA